ncbi:multicopper oxidase family protein [Sulfurimonas sp. MAG313]|nr:multicopper oxidase family protein [Sulfurimonas sp. MAG313]MDF1881101.1 multicopper oxidase family protein [Sulfurimonas sp. MAG313]
MARTFNFEENGVTVATKMNGRLSLAANTGMSIETWYFGNGFSGDRDWAGPIIEATQGEVVKITVTSEMAHSMHLHGLDVDQANDGVPATSGYIANEESNSAFGRVEGYKWLGKSYTYTFVAPHAGTYQYHCHVDTVLHYDMGMHGTIIIRPKSGNIEEAWDGGPTYTKEHVWQMGTFDTTWHKENISGEGTVRYRPDAFMINGVNGEDAKTDATVAITANAGEKVLIRTNQTSYQGAKIEFGGLPFELIAADGRPATNAPTVTSVYMTAGERYDILITMPSAGTYDASVTYYDSRGLNIIGSVSTTLTSL